jgi:nucleoside-diphosphate-sugar epimerase
MIKALVTGANGFIGHYLVKELKKRGYWVRTTGLDYNQYSNLGDDFKKGNLVNSSDCYKAIAGDVDWVFHMAAQIGGIKYISENESIIMHNNVVMDMNMIDAALNLGATKFFYPSSACVYPASATDSFDPKPITEDMAYPANPEVGYGWEKLYMEQTLLHYQKETKMNVKIARFFSTYGPDMDYEGDNVKSLMALCRKVAEAPDGGEIEVWGPGTQLRAFCYVEDVVDGIIRLTESLHTGPINMGNNASISINDLAKMIIDISGKNISIKNVEGIVGVKGRRCSIENAQKLLGWQPTTAMKIGVERTYEWVYKKINR